MASVRGRMLEPGYGYVRLSQFQMDSAAEFNRVVDELRESERVLILGTGERGLRFRPALTVTRDELDAAVDALDRVLGSI